MPAFDPEIKKKVEDYWADWKRRNPGLSANRRKLYRSYCKDVSNNDLGLSKFNVIVRELETAAPPEPFPRSEWKPWADQQDTPEDTAFLLRLNAVSQAEEGRNLINRAAEWARRLRVALEGLHPYGQYRVVEMYFLREMRVYYLSQELYTADLDGLLAYKPWLPQMRFAYDLAVASGSVPFPFRSLTNQPSFESCPSENQRQEGDQRFSFLWADSPEARENFMKHYDFRFGPAALVEMALGLRETQLVLGEDGQVQFKAGLTRVAYGEDDPIKGEMLNRLLKFWAGKTLEEINVEGGTDERQHQETEQE